MELVWGVVVIGLSTLCWGGQTVAWLAPSTAVRLGLRERDDSVDPGFSADLQGEAQWDTLTLWTMLVAGILLVLDSGAWPYFGLVGGGMYLYFAGRGIATRLVMGGRNLRIGTPESVRIAFVFLTIWGILAAVTIVAATAALR